MKSLVLFFFLPFSLLFARFPSFAEARGGLKAGTYHNLKPTEPIVLDSGRYTFVSLEMNHLGKEIWLDARKATSLTLLRCRFEGNENEMGLFASGDVTISHSEFRHFQTAIRYEDKGSQTLKLFRNFFEDNDSAVIIHPGSETLKLSFALKCNEFAFSSTGTKRNRMRKGLVIGSGVELGHSSGGIFIPQRMGSGERNFWDVYEYPNGNIWPDGASGKRERIIMNGMFVDLHHPDSSLALPNYPNWIAIDNQTGKSLQYHRYENEFVGWGKVILGEVDFVPSETNRKWRLEPGKTADTCAYTLQQPKGQTIPHVCEQLVDEQPFLLPTHWRREINKENLQPPNDKKPFASEPLYMPETGQTRIQCWLPQEVKQAMLQYLDKDGTVLQNNPISGRSWSEAMLDLRYTEPGTYNYRILTDGIPSQNKKLVITK